MRRRLSVLGAILVIAAYAAAAEQPTRVACIGDSIT